MNEARTGGGDRYMIRSFSLRYCLFNKHDKSVAG